MLNFNIVFKCVSVANNVNEQENFCSLLHQGYKSWPQKTRSQTKDLSSHWRKVCGIINHKSIGFYFGRKSI